MIADVCSAVLSNKAIKSNFCLLYLKNEYTDLEKYQYEHKREIGVNYDPMGDEKNRKRIHAVHFYIACICIVVINLCAWTIARHRTKREAHQRARELVNQRIQTYLELDVTERDASRV